MKTIDYYDLRIESIQCGRCFKNTKKGICISTLDGQGQESGYVQYCLECVSPTAREAWEAAEQRIHSLELPLGTASVIE